MRILNQSLYVTEVVIRSFLLSSGTVVNQPGINIQGKKKFKYRGSREPEKSTSLKGKQFLLL